MPGKAKEWRSCESEAGSVMDALRIPAIGYLPVKTAKANHQIPFEGICLVLKGRGFYQVNFRRKYRLDAPAVFYIWPGSHFHYGPDEGTTWEERYICFTGPRVNDWLKWRWLHHPDKPFPLREADFFAQQHQHISGGFTEAPSVSLEQAKLDAEQFVYGISRQTLTNPVEEDRLALLIRKWILSPEAMVDLPGAAKGLKMSYSSFRVHFERRTGLMPYQFLLRLRIDRACTLLIQTDQAVKAIAYDCGFDFAESFNRAFLRLKGMSPSAYRRQASVFTRSDSAWTHKPVTRRFPSVN